MKKVREEWSESSTNKKYYVYVGKKSSLVSNTGIIEFLMVVTVDVLNRCRYFFFLRLFGVSIVNNYRIAVDETELKHRRN